MPNSALSAISLVAIMLLVGTGSTELHAQATASKETVNFVSATILDAETPVSGELSLPAGSHEKVPAIVIIHNAGGLADGTGSQYVEALTQAGMATLELNLFPRGARPPTARINVPHTYGSLIYLATHPRIDASKIGIMGFSWGGVLSLVSASAEFTQMYTGGKYRFAAHLPLYPACSAHIGLLEGKNKNYSPSIYQALTGSPVHILAGEKDDYDDPDSCVTFVQMLPANARRYVNVTVYPGVGHGWDTLEDRQYQDPIANKGRGGYVRHYRNRATAEKSKAFAIEFFKSNLIQK